MPRAMSRPRQPVETASVARPRSRLPSFITEPLPNARSIWLSAASSARLRSEFCSLPTTRKAACAMTTLLGYSTAPADPQANPAAGGEDESTWFVLFGKTRDKALKDREITTFRSGIVPARNFWELLFSAKVIKLLYYDNLIAIRYYLHYSRTGIIRMPASADLALSPTFERARALSSVLRWFFVVNLGVTALWTGHSARLADLAASRQLQSATVR